jgi:iron(III)-salmochelin esterase
VHRDGEARREHRRDFLRDVTAWSGALLFGGVHGCHCPPSAPEGGEQLDAASTPPHGPWQSIDFNHDSEMPEGQAALVRLGADAATLPVVVALHGRGEAGRGLEAGRRGWRDDYRLERMLERLAAPPISAADTLDMIDAGRLATINAELAAHPFGGLVVVCPYTPVPGSSAGRSIESFGAFVAGPLLGRVAALRGAPIEVARTGIDGVSMGGRWALELGLRFPRVFGSVGALQPAIRVDEADTFAERALSAMAVRPQSIRLATSDGDPFREPTEALARALERRAVPHRLVITRGPHDYAWNRGPGSLELALFHERTLRGLAVP